MTEAKKIEKIACARMMSEHLSKIVYCMTNGNDVWDVYNYDEVETFKSKGYWIASIFENGRKVEA